MKKMRQEPTFRSRSAPRRVAQFYSAAKHVAISVLLSTASAGCGSSEGTLDLSSQPDASPSDNGCSETRCDGERSQCVQWYALYRDDCTDGCSGTLDILGCLDSCYTLIDGLIESDCDSERDQCEESNNVNECWDDPDENGECSGTSPISCDGLPGSACTAVAGCDSDRYYIEVLDEYGWSCDGEPANCSTMNTAEECRALRCTWQ